MVWRIDGPQGFESDKIAAVMIPYCRGRGLDIGCGQRKVWPHAIGIDSGHHFGDHTDCDIRGDGTQLEIIADKSMDFVFSSHTLEHFPKEKCYDILREWGRVLKPGGYLTLYVPSANLYPKCGEPGANPDHKWDIYPGDIFKILEEATPYGWEMVEGEERGLNNEYSLFEVYKKREVPGMKVNIWQRNPEDKKRCLVIRYGAIGDQIIAASIMPELKKQGYFTTYNTTPEAADVLKCDPYIDEFLLQDKDQVPNMQLGPYWQEVAKRYDRVINLCESVEAALLTMPERLTHEYPHEVRHKLYGAINYLERTHDIAGVPHNFAPHFYPSPEDEKWAAVGIDMVRKKKAPLIIWCINGSSPHKVYPYTQVVVSWLLKRTPAEVFLYADPGVGKQLQDGIIECLKDDGVDISRVHGIAGKWSIRQSLTFAKHADVVIGPETGPLNAVCMDAMRKIIYLSHSSHENLTKHWINTEVLTPDTKQCPCYPCHRLHFTWQYCHQDEKTSAALCASGISPERLFKAISEAISPPDAEAAE